MIPNDTPSVIEAKQHIVTVISVLRENDSGYADKLQDYLDGMVDWYTTKENLFRIGELCHPKALGGGFMIGWTATEWLDEISTLRDVCARAFNELERCGA